MKNLIEDDWVNLCNNLWEVLTGIFLDSRTPIERLYKSLENLKKRGLLDYRELRAYGGDPELDADFFERIAQALKDAGYPWYNQKAKCFRDRIKFDLETATYDQMKTLWGIGDKLASLWMAIVHGSNDYPIIDIHVKRYLKEKGYNSKDYAVLAEAFKKEAEKQNMSVLELDKKVLEAGLRQRRGF